MIDSNSTVRPESEVRDRRRSVVVVEICDCSRRDAEAVVVVEVVEMDEGDDLAFFICFGCSGELM